MSKAAFENEADYFNISSVPFQRKMFSLLLKMSLCQYLFNAHNSVPDTCACPCLIFV